MLFDFYCPIRKMAIAYGENLNELARNLIVAEMRAGRFETLEDPQTGVLRCKSEGILRMRTQQIEPLSVRMSLQSRLRKRVGQILARVRSNHESLDRLHPDEIARRVALVP